MLLFLGLYCPVKAGWASSNQERSAFPILMHLVVLGGLQVCMC